MKLSLASLAALAAATTTTASPLVERQNGSGDGPFAPAVSFILLLMQNKEPHKEEENHMTNTSPKHYYTNSGLSRHTFFAPHNIPAGAKLPVIVWGNGACSADSLGQAPFLTQLASYGALVIVSGTPRGGGSTNDAMMRQAIDFITANAGRGQFAQVDVSRITAAGFSCGGVEAYAQINDNRVSNIGIWSSGLLGDYDRARNFRKPVFFFMGGPSDIAYGNGERDYSYMPAGVPKWKGNLNVGHGGTYHEFNGGKFGIIGGRWVQWVMRGNQTAAQYLTGDGARRDGWQVVSQDLQNLRVNPI